MGCGSSTVIRPQPDAATLQFDRLLEEEKAEADLHFKVRQPATLAWLASPLPTRPTDRPTDRRRATRSTTETYLRPAKTTHLQNQVKREAWRADACVSCLVLCVCVRVPFLPLLSSF